jgi:hypothetical protein
MNEILRIGGIRRYSGDILKTGSGLFSHIVVNEHDIGIQEMQSPTLRRKRIPQEK